MMTELSVNPERVTWVIVVPGKSVAATSFEKPLSFPEVSQAVTAK
jgi:hypothetical protein